METSDVLLRRRDAPDLWLTQAAREDLRSETFAALGRALRNLAVHNPNALDEALGDAFPWLEVMPSLDRRSFVEEFTRLLVGSASLGTYEALEQLVQEWRATAEVHANPRLAHRLRADVVAEGAAVHLPGR